ncbi:hypothetical protein G1L22_13215 [Tenacibaculum finnmarkense]|uniref:hypothetical protein n=1 Tax=Tenacibaculum finnmarkense TaxID=2781243 RepID=UPI001EFB4743|nr:hypothetical protein [Tenacibaculum finnmarkense]MCG8740061.1 hypothetical protein [Tenacibaculum finnmarkense]MCG8781674.1 hypothetical protein [Tenacibaculum finnmarkense]MCG8791507.1 hypothetical protein [Tenacibaculum finnmarkense]MCG8801580.1 hypothetical protein [Tenacibaculum finnmarkense]MCG8914006.1 hypothetical protein [Tenacibaculum finnmarkense]
MAKKHSIDTIAEVLIDKLESMEQVAVKIEKVAKNPLKVDLKEQEILLNNFKEFLNNKNRVENRILSQLENLESKNKGRLPNWVLAVLFSFFIGLIGSIYISYSSIKKVNLLEEENTYYKTKYIELKNKK